jgi:L-alanine-DL-glutamate epimerase-like enolase superfamily enzyme
MSAGICPSLRPLKVWLSDVIGGTGHHTQFRRGLELTLRVNDGLWGVGEASPLPFLSTEHLEDVETQLASIAPFQVDLPDSPPACRPFIENLAERAGCRVASARFAFEGALVDLCSRHLGIPAPSLLAQMTTTLRASEQIEVAKLLSNTDLPSLLRAASRAVARGYRTFKVKLGSVENFDSDLVRLVALRELLDSSAKLRLDPNQSWPKSELPYLLGRLRAISPELVEEPVAATDLLELDASPVPLAVDESLRTEGMLETLAPHVRRLEIRAVIIKPALLGLLRSFDLAERARSLGLDVIVTHLFDGPVGHATAASLALAIGSQTRAQGLAPHPGLLLCPERRILGLGAGKLSLVDQPGLPLSGVVRC